MEINNNESTIDLRKFLDIAKEKKTILIAIIAICTIIATIAAFVLPKQYSSSSMVKIKSTGDLNNIPVMLTNMASQLGMDAGTADGNSPETYIEMMKSRVVIEPIIDSLNSYDKAIAQLQAEADGDNAKLAGVTGQLEQQNAALLEYKVSDNVNVGNIREAIVNKRVELVGLEQRFTDEHPDVIRAKEELNSLNDSLSKEINNAISSQSVTLSPVQSSLLQSKLETETKIAVDNASLEALKAKEAEAQTSIANLTSDNVEYARLLRDAKTKGEIYTTLVKYYEQSKINESNKAMNIQIISEPDLAKEDMPAKPNKKIIIMAGFVLGIMISAGYIIYIYSRRYGL